MSDQELLASSFTGFEEGMSGTRNLVAYGNEASNRVIAEFLKGSPLRVGNGRLSVGERALKGEDLSFLAYLRIAGVRKIKIGDTSDFLGAIAIIGGTGIVGMRGTDLMPYFVSGVHYPDLFVYDSRNHTIGSKAVRAAGYFGNDWSVEKGDIAWRD
jgi:hypothetical protein